MMSLQSSMHEQIAGLGPWFHNLHLPDGTQTSPHHPFGDFPSFKWQHVAGAVPDDLSGWSVLDIGCNAGFYSFELARRGAHVLGVDVEPMYVRQARWAAREFDLDDRVDFIEGDVYGLLGSNRRYDLVWFTGVFYHLRYPALALDLVRRATQRLMVFQSMTLPGDVRDVVPQDVPLNRRELMLDEAWPKMAFVEHRVADDDSNWWVPNASCVEALLRSAGFEVMSRPEHEFYVCRPVPVPAESSRDLARITTTSAVRDCSGP
ncbi:TIGR04290 family methyltransferase [Steroidobacter cummioxidans]|uniref:TIGR04290 family methyltransferase n=1 Tax=Steroidobacter cummioxidans TaxID=1803913 RepID=UPI000E31389A|nr:TIGR04290 family methyltransferase [Steroidobacter cummioxidans]